MQDFAAALQRQAKLDAIAMSLPLAAALKIQAAFDKADQLQRQAALDAVAIDLPLDVAVKLQAVFDA